MASKLLAMQNLKEKAVTRASAVRQPRRCKEMQDCMHGHSPVQHQLAVHPMQLRTGHAPARGTPTNQLPAGGCSCTQLGTCMPCELPHPPITKLLSTPEPLHGRMTRCHLLAASPPMGPPAHPSCPSWAATYSQRAGEQACQGCPCFPECHQPHKGLAHPRQGGDLPDQNPHRRG